MSAQSVARQVEELKTRVTALEQLPARFDALEGQVSHMLVEIRAEFSAVRGEMRTGFAQVREEIRAGDEETRRVLREEIRAGDEETRRVLREEIRAGDEETRRVLREEIRAGDEQTRVHTRLLHEETLSRLALIDEGRPRRRKRR